MRVRILSPKLSFVFGGKWQCSDSWYDWHRAWALACYLFMPPAGILLFIDSFESIQWGCAAALPSIIESIFNESSHLWLGLACLLLHPCALHSSLWRTTPQWNHRATSSVTDSDWHYRARARLDIIYSVRVPTIPVNHCKITVTNRFKEVNIMTFQ